MKFSLIHPSRGRPEQALAAYKNWFIKSGFKDIEHILSLDVSDPMLDSYQGFHNSRVVVNPNTCVVEAANKAAELATGEVLIYMSDDFDCPVNWDVLIKHRTERLGSRWLLKVNDGLQPVWNKVLTIPIMSMSLYKELGYLFHPDYKSMWVDVDLWLTVNQMGCLSVDNNLLFPHNHWSNGKAKKDETYGRSEIHWEQGRQALIKRAESNKWSLKGIFK